LWSKTEFFSIILQFFEWLEANKHLDFIERDYASYLDLIAKIHGIQKAEKYIAKIPKSFQGEVVYRTFLASCVASGNIKKSEEVFMLCLQNTTFMETSKSRLRQN